VSASAHLPSPLSGRVALVTGGGGGVGRATALALARAGCDVALVGRSRGPLEAACLEVSRTGRRAMFGVADVADRRSVAKSVADATAALGAPLVLVTAAGIAEASAILPPDDALFDRTIATNLRGPWIASTEVLPAMRAARFGRIVHVASTAALEGSRYTAAYVASKHGLLGLTRATALDVARDGVTVNAVCPGFLDTPMTERSIAKIRETTGRTSAEALTELLRSARQTRLVAPATVADSIVALLLDPARTGSHVELRA
jgi:3-hydroxybutyrate dehydrogenase